MSDESNARASLSREKLMSLRLDPAAKAPRSSKLRGILFLAIGIGVGIAVSQGGSGTDTAKATSGTTGTSTTAATAAPTPAADAAAAPAIEQKPGDVALSANGYVTPRHRVALSPKIIGRVAWVGVEKGDNVEKGQVLVRLEDSDYLAREKEGRARVAMAEARLKELEAGARAEELARAKSQIGVAEARLKQMEQTLKRRLELASDSVESQQRLDDAQADRDVASAELDMSRHALSLLEAGARAEQIDHAKAELDAAKAAAEVLLIDVENTVIRAPLTGTVMEKLIEPGELVTPQSFGGERGARTELLSLADLNDLQVEIDLNESDIAKIKMGQGARVVLDAYPDVTYPGEVREIAPEANRQKATVQIKVRITKPDALIRPEMSARVDLLQQ